MKRRTSIESHLTPADAIVRVSGVHGGDPTIQGSRISVTDIVRYARMKLEELLSTDESLPHPPPKAVLLEEPWRSPVLRAITKSLPTLTEEQVLAAWQYFVTNENEISQLLAEEDAAVEKYRPRAR